MFLAAEQSVPHSITYADPPAWEPNRWFSRLAGRAKLDVSDTRFLFRSNPKADPANFSPPSGREKRQREFAVGRKITAQLLGELGEQQPSVGVNDDRSPAWPAGFVGSITHSDRWTGVAVARSTALRSIGIDTEPVMSGESFELIQQDVASPRELQSLRWLGFTAEQTLTLIFSAKESFYKCRYPLDQQFLEFQDVRVVAATAKCLTLRSTQSDSCSPVLSVHYHVGNDNVFTATWLAGGSQ